jgi:DNA-directed RNA polymerase sigma subunit (sigma70/sigma32)
MQELPDITDARDIFFSISELIKEGKLSDKEQNVINLRFGLEDNKLKTLQEVGNTLGYTRERVRQIQNIALDKIRNKYNAIRN